MMMWMGHLKDALETKTDKLGHPAGATCMMPRWDPHTGCTHMEPFRPKMLNFMIF